MELSEQGVYCLPFHLHPLGALLYEPRHDEKTCLQGLRPGKTQTGLLSYRDQLES